MSDSEAPAPRVVPTPAAEAEPVVVAEPAADADPRVVDALSRLDELTDLPLAEQVEVFTDVHRRLAAVLADPASRG